MRIADCEDLGFFRAVDCGIVFTLFFDHSLCWSIEGIESTMHRLFAVMLKIR